MRNMLRVVHAVALVRNPIECDASCGELRSDVASDDLQCMASDLHSGWVRVWVLVGQWAAAQQ